MTPLTEWDMTVRFGIAVEPSVRARAKAMLTDAIAEAARSIAEDLNDERTVYEVTRGFSLRMRERQ